MTTIQSDAEELMMAEILFDDPDTMRRAMPVLVEQGFNVRHIEGLHDPLGTPCAWLLAWKATELDMDGFFAAVQAVVAPWDADVLEAGPAELDELANWRADEINS